MGLDFDVLEFCKKLRQDRPPPYQCPLEKCDRVYKSLCGLQYHLVNYDHDNPTPLTPSVIPGRKKGGRSRAPVATGDIALQSPPKEALTFAEAQKVVQFEIDGKISRISIDQVLPVVSLEDWTKKNSELEKPFTFVEPAPEPHIKLPEASYKILNDYNIPDAPPRPNAYIRFIEKSAEELDGEVEYDVDEEDTAWLSILNDKRQKQNLPLVSVDTLELLMDRLEKESYFQAAQSGQSSGSVVDEDAVCCICMDGECQNTNVILFCDMCNLAVHQDCYGVPYIPEGQWLCRRCLQSPSRLVDCVLCPNTGGAFKQTDRGHWAHVVCALWIPEVRFANTVFLEPIDSIETIPMARWKLTCYVCKQRGVGACIQCHRANCYAAFHVTCAQHAGLHMKMDAVNGTSRGGALDAAQSIQVAKMAYCDAHTPAGAQKEKLAAIAALTQTKTKDDGEIIASTPVNKKQAFLGKLQARSECREKMKQARRMLAKKRSSVPVVLIPTIPLDRVQEIASLVQMAGRAPFVQRLIAYWTLKRQYRNGVPLLRRLQSLSHHSGGTRSGVQEGSVDTRELYNQLKYWQRIRQDLERARLLCELVRKRERIKAEFTRVRERELLHQLKPLEAALRKLLYLIQSKDSSDIFSEPVDPTEVPDYSSVVTHPMDLSTMSQKLDKGLYPDLNTLEKDFNLMIANCLAYNSKDTVFYKAGTKMMEQGGTLIKQARKDMIEAGYIENPSKDHVAQPVEKTPVKKQRERRQSTTSPVKEHDANAKIEEELNTLLNEKHPCAETMQRLCYLATRWKKSSQNTASPRLARRLRAALQNTDGKPTGGGRRRRRRRGPSEVSASEAEEGMGGVAGVGVSPPGTPHTPQMSERNERTPSKHTPPSVATPGEPSPTGVNRRTAVLFTRKAQSAAAFSNIKVPRRAELTALSDKPSQPLPIASLAKHLPNGSTSPLDVLGSSASLSATPVVEKKKGRGRPRKHNKEKVGQTDKTRPPDKPVSSGHRQTSSTASQTSVPASFLVYRGPRDEVGSGVDSDSARSTGSYTSTCSSCTHYDHEGMSSCSDSCSITSGSDRSSCFNDTMESTTNQTASDTEHNVTRMSGSKIHPSLHSSSRRWSSDLSDGEGSHPSTATTLPPTTPVKNPRRRGRTPGRPSNKPTPTRDGSEILDSSNLAPLQLVWAKCRGYPWYPALIIDPKIPKGFVHHGVPLPVPPQDVLALKKNHQNEPVLFLVLFFDAKRTWQWLPPNKLEILGIEKSVDQSKLVESRKPTERKAVKKAYQDAMQYSKQVDGDPVLHK